MTLQEIFDVLQKSQEGNLQLSQDELTEIISQLALILKNQNQMLYDIKNSSIRMENKMKFLEQEVEKSKVYKDILDGLVERINNNPIGALIYLYKVRGRLDKLSKNQ